MSASVFCHEREAGLTDISLFIALKEKDGLQQGKKVQSIAEDELEAIKLQLKEINGPNKFKEEAYFIWAELIVSL